jgi:hypothetical protein
MNSITNKKYTMQKQPLISFHGDQKIKDAHVNRLQIHHDQDEFVQGKYWENGKGCDTGCAFHSDNRSLWASELGIPLQIGYLRERIFESLPNSEAKDFPLACSKATPVGKNLNPVWKKFIIWVLTDPTYGVLQYAKTDEQRKAIQDVADAYTTWLTAEVPTETWQQLRRAAAAYAAAAYAAYAAYARREKRNAISMAFRNKLIQLLQEA